MKICSTMLALPLILFGTASLIAQDDRPERSEDGDRSRPRVAAEAHRDDGVRSANKGVRGREAARDRRGSRGDGDVRDSWRGFGDRRRDWPGARTDELLRRGTGPDRRGGDFRRGPSARMLLARFDRDGDRELDVRELSRLLDRMPRFGAGSGGPARGRDFDRGPGPRRAGGGDERRFGGGEDRPDGRSVGRKLDHPPGFRPEGFGPSRERPFERRLEDEERGDRSGRPLHDDPN